MDVNEIGAKDVGNAAKKVAGALGKKIVGNKVSSDSNLSPTLIKQITPYADQLESVLSNRALRTEFLALIKKVETNTPGPLGGLSGRVYDKFNKGVQGVKGAASAIKSKATKTTDPRKPATQDATAAPTAPKPAPTSPALSSYFQNFSKAMKGASDKNQKISLAKELVNTVADRGGEDSETAVSVLRKFGGDLDNNFKQAAMNALKTGQRLLKQSVYYEINKMLKEHDLSWSDLGMRVHLLEGTNKMFGISLI